MILFEIVIIVVSIFTLGGLASTLILAGMGIWQLHTVGWIAETPFTKFLYKVSDFCMWCAGITVVLAGLIKFIIFII